MTKGNDCYIRAKAAREFARSMRGQYIIGQALTVAIQVLEEVDGLNREDSNISDMKYLRDYVFPLYAIADDAKFEVMMKRLNGELE